MAAFHPMQTSTTAGNLLGFAAERSYVLENLGSPGGGQAGPPAAAIDRSADLCQGHAMNCKATLAALLRAAAAAPVSYYWMMEAGTG